MNGPERLEHLKLCGIDTTAEEMIDKEVDRLLAALYIPVTAFNAVGESWEWAPFYVLSIGVELLLLAFILRASWAWPRIPAAAPVPVDEIRR